MARRKKLEKFAAIRDFKNVLENYHFDNDVLRWKDESPVRMHGRWAKDYFNNTNPLTLELACGYGEYTVALAEIQPSKNYIGVDIKGNRIYQGAKKALNKKMNNVAFLRTRIEQVDRFFEEGEVSEIWITFPDPFLKKGKSNRRLTASHFLDRYKKILSRDASIFLKTDSTEMFDYTTDVLKGYSGAEIIVSSRDICSDKLIPRYPQLSISTRYEIIHTQLGKKIKFIHFRLKK